MSWVSNLGREIASSNTSQNAQSCLLQARHLVLCVNPLNLPSHPMTHVPLGHPRYRCGPRGRERLGNTFEVSLGHRPRQLRPRSVFNHRSFPPSSLGRAGGNLRGGPHLGGAGLVFRTWAEAGGEDRRVQGTAHVVVDVISPRPPSAESLPPAGPSLSRLRFSSTIPSL